MKYFCLLMLLGLPLSVQSKDTFIDIHLTSYHMKDGYIDKEQGIFQEYNNRNTGFGITHQMNGWLDFKAGFVENSHYNTAVYVGVQPFIRLFRNSGPFDYRAGITIVATTGYIGVDNGSDVGLPLGHKVSILALPNISVGLDKFYVNFGFLPGTVATLSLQYKIR